MVHSVALGEDLLMNYVVIALLVVVGIYDIYLAVKKHPTISQQYQALFPTWMDMIICGLVMYTLIAHHPWLDWRLKVLIAGIIGHVVWSNSERYGKHGK